MARQGTVSSQYRVFLTNGKEVQVDYAIDYANGDLWKFEIFAVSSVAQKQMDKFLKAGVPVINSHFPHRAGCMFALLLPAALCFTWGLILLHKPFRKNAASLLKPDFSKPFFEIEKSAIAKILRIGFASDTVIYEAPQSL